MRGIAIRQELTEEWKQRGIDEDKDFAILTSEISKATFGKTVEEYKKHKNLKKGNLRDHMNDLELIFSMLGEKVTTEITRAKDAKKMKELKTAAKEGGLVAGNARKDAEQKIGKIIVSKENYLNEPEKETRKRLPSAWDSSFERQGESARSRIPKPSFRRVSASLTSSNRQVERH